MYNDDRFYQNGKFLPKDGDVMVFFLKIVSDNVDIDITNNDAVWTGRFLDYKRKYSPDDVSLVLTVVDFNYDVFNRFHTLSYIGKNMKTNEVLTNVIKTVSESLDGDGTFKFDFSNVASTRHDGSDFPIIEPVFSSHKPVYEWVVELSSINWTNSDTEITNDTLVNTRNMIFDIRNRDVYWFYPSDVPVYTFNDDLFIDSIEEVSNVEQTVNRLILDCGSDFNGRPITLYLYDEKNNTGIVKEKTEVKKVIAGDNTDYDNTYHQLRSQYSASTNDAFREKVRQEAKKYADVWFFLYGREEKKVKMNLTNVHINYGDTIKLDLENFKKGNFRVESVTVSGNQKQISTSITLKEIIDY
jgi:hypothetical protein